MIKILLYFSLMITISSCAVAQSNEHSSNSLAPTASTKTTPTPNSTPIPSSAIAEKLANRTSTRLELSQMKKMKLDQQPTIFAKTLFYYDDNTFSQKKLAAYSRKKEIYVSERDLNHDGVAERIVYDPKSNSPSFYIFNLYGKNWKHLFASSGDITIDENTSLAIGISLLDTPADKNTHIGDPLTVEFLSSGVSGDFDIIKTTTATSNNERTELSREVEYFLFVKDGGELDDDRIEPEMLEVFSPDDYSRFYVEGYQCPIINLKVDESQPCFNSNREDRDYLERMRQREKRKAEENKER
jgi:hypothetical protein